MVLDEASYYTRRALTQLGQAAAASDDAVARVHAELSDLYLERARKIVASAVGSRPNDASVWPNGASVWPNGASVWPNGNVFPLRAIA